MSGTVERFDNRFIYVNLGRSTPKFVTQDQTLRSLLLPTIVSKSTFTRLKTILVVSTSLLAEAIQK